MSALDASSPVEDAVLFAIAVLLLGGAPTAWAMALSQAPTWERTGLLLSFAPAAGISMLLGVLASFSLVDALVAMREERSPSH